MGIASNGVEAWHLRDRHQVALGTIEVAYATLSGPAAGTETFADQHSRLIGAQREAELGASAKAGLLLRLTGWRLLEHGLKPAMPPTDHSRSVI